MAESDGVFLTVTDAARRLGVCAKTFRKMIKALPAGKRPKFEPPPGMTRKRYRRNDIDTAFAAASASSGWDRKLEERGHAETRGNKRVGQGRGR